MFKQPIYVLLAFFPLLLLAQTQRLETFDIQGDGLTSPFVGETVTLDTSIVTFARPDIAYVQATKGDNNPATSDGLLLSGGNLLSLTPGDLVVVSGRVLEDDRATTLSGPFTITKVGSADLPPPTVLSGETSFSEVPYYERFEGMLVRFDLTVGQGTTSFGSARVYPTNDRPYREPGLLPPGIEGLPLWDGNPELISYDPDGLNGPATNFLNAGDQITGIGIVEEFSFGYELSPIQIPNLTSVDPVRRVRSGTADELTVASLNTLFFLDEEDGYAVKLNKIVSYIGEVLALPDVIALQEIGGQSEVEDLVFRLRQLDPERGNYRGFSGTGTGSLRNGFLVRRSIEEVEAEELGTNEFLSSGGILHDRPPLLLRLEVPGTENTELQVLNLHLRSLNGVSDASDFVRRKRFEQSVSVARMVEELRGDNLVVIGDFNAFGFSDGYVDVMAQITGTPSLGALIPVEPIVDPPLDILSTTILPPEEQYSFVFRGSAQQLDHCVANDLSGLEIRELAYGRGNADASVNFSGQAFQLARSSDHDGFVLYLGIDAVSSTEDYTASLSRPLFPNPARTGDPIVWSGESNAQRLFLVNAAGQSVWTIDEPTNGQEWPVPALPAGNYWLTVDRKTGLSSYPIVIVR